MPTNLVLLAVSAVLYNAIFPINRWAANAGWPLVAFAAAQLLLAGGVVLVPLALLIDPSLLPGTMGFAVVATLLAGTVVNAVVIIMFFEVIRRAGPAFGSLFHYVALPAGVVWSIAAFGVLPPAIFRVAVVVMLGAVAAAVGGPRQAG
jgi:drug/metabolite transporter (DMT)-like permease